MEGRATDKIALDCVGACEQREDGHNDHVNRRRIRITVD